MIFKIKADGSNAEAELKRVQKYIDQLGGPSAANLQKGFKSAASEASNFVAILTGDKLTGATSQITAFAGAVGAIPGPVGLAIGAVTGLAAAGIGLGAVMFGLVKNASDYGSQIHDIAQKTDLSTEAISSMKVAAEQSGTTIEQVSSAIEKFAKNVGAAADGSDKAKKSLTALGVDPQAALKGMDTALAQVFQRIHDAKPGFEQITLAQKAFGKAGAELIPFIEQFNGDLPKLIQHMKDLGITISGQDADAADAFGDQMVELESQIGAVVRKIGFAAIPAFEDLARTISQALTDNESAIQSWASYIGNVLSGVVASFHDAGAAISRFMSESRAFGQSPFGTGVPGGASTILYGMLGGAALAPLEERGKQANAGSAIGSIFGTASKAKPKLPAFGGGGGGGKGGGGKAKADNTEVRELTAQIALQQEALKSLREDYRDTMDEAAKQFKATGNQAEYNASAVAAWAKASAGLIELQGKLTELLDKQAKLKNETPSEYALRLKKQADDFKSFMDELGKGLDRSTGEIDEAAKKQADIILRTNNDLTEKLREINQKRSDNFLKDDEEQWDEAIANEEGNLAKQNDLRIQAMLDIEQAYSNAHQAELDRIDDEYKADKDKIDKEVTDETAKNKAIADLDELYKQKRLLSEEEFQKRKADIEKKYAQGVSADDFDPNDGFGELQKAVNTHLSGDTLMAATAGIQVMATAFSQLGEAVGEAVKGFVLFGSAGQGLKQFTATLIAEIAKMAAVQAIWELAQGFAMLAINFFWPDPKAAASAAAHFHSAAIYGGIAAIAAGAGRKVAGDSFKTASGSGGSSSSSGSSQNTSPYSRGGTNVGTGTSGKTGNFFADSHNRLAAAIENLEAMSPGDVLVKGAKQSPGLIGHHAVMDIRSDNGLANKMVRATGGGPK